MTFVLSTREYDLESLDEWISDTTNITRREGLQWYTVHFAKDGTTSLLYECTEEEYERFKSKYELKIDHEIDGIIFLKSNSFFLKGDHIYEKDEERN